MPKNYRNILPLISEEVLDFFMKSELFHGFELLEYFQTSSMHHPKHLIMDLLKDIKEKQDIINKMYDKLYKQHYSDYNQLWLLNMIYTQDKKRKKSPYTMRLCQFVVNESCKPLWNNEWLNSELSSKLLYDLIVNKETLDKVTPVIVFRETRAYNESMLNC